MASSDCLTHFFRDQKKRPVSRPGAESNLTLTESFDSVVRYAKMSKIGLPLSPTVKGRLLGDITTSSTGRPIA